MKFAQDLLKALPTEQEMTAAKAAFKKHGILKRRMPSKKDELRRHLSQLLNKLKVITSMARMLAKHVKTLDESEIPEALVIIYECRAARLILIKLTETAEKDIRDFSADKKS
jgi:hypothetical protein